MAMQVIINQILILGVLIIVGAIGTWTKVISDYVKDAISKLVFNITLPLLIVTTFSNMELNADIIRNGLWVLLFSNIAFVLLWIVGSLTSNLFRLKIRQHSIHTLHTMFGNIVFLGFPLIRALFKENESMLYAALYYLVSNYIMWTFGITLLQKSPDKKRNFKWKKLANPNTIAFGVGLLFMITRINIPKLIFQPLESMGSITIYLSMLYIGSVLATTNVKSLYRKPDIFVLSLNKLIVVPIILLLIINGFIYLLGIDYDMIAKTVVILQTGMPCMSIIVILARNYKADDKKAVEQVFVTTILSLFTLPFLYYVIQLLS
jgi:hypothetical protein